MKREGKIENLCYDIWRQYPNHAATFGPCQNSGDGKFHESARGSGACVKCIEKELADLVGSVLAHGYRSHVEEIRELEKEMMK